MTTTPQPVAETNVANLPPKWSFEPSSLSNVFHNICILASGKNLPLYLKDPVNKKDVAIKDYVTRLGAHTITIKNDYIPYSIDIKALFFRIPLGASKLSDLPRFRVDPVIELTKIDLEKLDKELRHWFNGQVGVKDKSIVHFVPDMPDKTLFKTASFQAYVLHEKERLKVGKRTKLYYKGSLEGSDLELSKLILDVLWSSDSFIRTDYVVSKLASDSPQASSIGLRQTQTQTMQQVMSLDLQQQIVIEQQLSLSLQAPSKRVIVTQQILQMNNAELRKRFGR